MTDPGRYKGPGNDPHLPRFSINEKAGIAGIAVTGAILVGAVVLKDPKTDDPAPDKTTPTQTQPPLPPRPK